MDLSRRRRLFYRVHLIGAKGEGGGCGIQWISTSPATLPKLCADRPDQVASAWEAALAADRPVVVEFKTDPEVPPLPPHITLKQAKSFVATLWKGDPEESGVIVGTARQVLSSILPGARTRSDAV